jgi:uncharacterized membrane protein
MTQKTAIIIQVVLLNVVALIILADWIRNPEATEMQMFQRHWMSIVPLLLVLIVMWVRRK